jgi:hypothetical protein
MVQRDPYMAQNASFARISCINKEFIAKPVLTNKVSRILTTLVYQRATNARHMITIGKRTSPQFQRSIHSTKQRKRTNENKPTLS